MNKTILQKKMMILTKNNNNWIKKMKNTKKIKKANYQLIKIIFTGNYPKLNIQNYKKLNKKIKKEKDKFKKVWI